MGLSGPRRQARRFLNFAARLLVAERAVHILPYFRFPRLLKNLGSRFLCLVAGLPGEFFVGKTLAHGFPN